MQRYKFFSIYPKNIVFLADLLYNEYISWGNKIEGMSNADTPSILISKQLLKKSLYFYSHHVVCFVFVYDE